MNMIRVDVTSISSTELSDEAITTAIPKRTNSGKIIP